MTTKPTQFDETTNAEAKKHSDRKYFPVHEQHQMWNSYEAGRLSVRDSLAVAVRALETIVAEGELGGSGTDADVAGKALAAIRAAGNYPLTEKEQG